MDKNIAEKTSLLALKMGADLDNHLLMIKESCLESEFKKYQKATGKIMTELLVSYMNPIYEQYPELKPKEMGGTYKIDTQVYE
jgi:hypothetical protein